MRRLRRSVRGRCRDRRQVLRLRALSAGRAAENVPRGWCWSAVGGADLLGRGIGSEAARRRDWLGVLLLSAGVRRDSSAAFLSVRCAFAGGLLLWGWCCYLARGCCASARVLGAAAVVVQSRRAWKVCGV